MTASGAINMSYYSRCLNTNSPMKQMNKCDSLKVDTVVSFQAEIEVTTCPTNRKDSHEIFQMLLK